MYYYYYPNISVDEINCIVVRLSKTFLDGDCIWLTYFSLSGIVIAIVYSYYYLRVLPPCIYVVSIGVCSCGLMNCCWSLCCFLDQLLMILEFVAPGTD